MVRGLTYRITTAFWKFALFYRKVQPLYRNLAACGVPEITRIVTKWLMWSQRLWWPNWASKWVTILLVAKHHHWNFHASRILDQNGMIFGICAPWTLRGLNLAISVSGSADGCALQPQTSSLIGARGVHFTDIPHVIGYGTKLDMLFYPMCYKKKT